MGFRTGAFSVLALLESSPWVPQFTAFPALPVWALTWTSRSRPYQYIYLLCIAECSLTIPPLPLSATTYVVCGARPAACDLLPEETSR
ncbi:hypothetical protein L227DRAFT_577155 [Lentinus tigrinus ALCF2SS1-6]|uniref:Uncharacterized protein n=1 Tax=Lentinus tigrinus ALCF2SS1-6 TaxID=1328759 RepID=A0A5C2S610_9APHY|nr:hypothetical protein L227DRAFT_577155 [Lentinus tigrinus ALCF2SS1-6]